MKAITKLRPLNICVIGVGQMGRIFLPIVCQHPLAIPHTIVARSFDAERVAQIRSENSIPDFYPTAFVESKEFPQYLNEKKDEIDGFLALGTTSSHFEYIKLLAPLGKPILMEKPLTDNREDSLKSIELLQKYNTRLALGFNRRYDPSYRELYKKVKLEKQVGRVQSVFTRFGDFYGPPLKFLKEGGELIVDCGCHDLDYIRYLQGDKPIRVTAVSSRVAPEYIEAGCDDSAYVFCEFKDGSVSMSEIRRVSKHGYDIRCEVSGPEGIVEVENIPSTSVSSSFGQFKNKSKAVYPLYPERFKQAYTNEFQELVEMILDEKREPSITAQEIIDVQQMVDAATLSAKEKRPVELK